MKTKAASSVDRMFRAFSDRTRLRILSMLDRSPAGQGELCVCEIVGVLGVPQPKVSRHLAYLRRAGLVEARRDGLWMYYRLAPAPVGVSCEVARLPVVLFRGCAATRAGCEETQAAAGLL